MEITYHTRIVNVGHLPGHTHGKTTLLKEAGFVNTESYLFTEQGVEGVKELVKGKNDTLLLFGGAMMHGFPNEMKELLEFLKSEEPNVMFYITAGSDFPPGTTYPPSEEVVNQSAVTICNRLLKKAAE